MITLITGQPGAGKTLYVVSELLFKMVNDTFEFEAETRKRVIYTNIKGLLVEHVHMDAKDLMTWPDWVKPGDIICFDEVQEVWRPRGMSTNPPPAIQALEVHRSKYSIDCIFMTQHPMLLDQNIRRLVNRHLHIRRIGKAPLAWVYEWDHTSNPSMVKSAVSSGQWWYPRWAYKLYVSSKVHTSQPRSMPKALTYLALFSVVSFFLFFPQFFPDALTPAYFQKKPVAVVTTVTESKGNIANIKPVQPVESPPVALKVALAPVGPIEDLKALDAPFKPLGCVASSTRCECFGDAGELIPVIETECRKASVQIAYIKQSNRPVSPPVITMSKAPDTASTPVLPSEKPLEDKKQGPFVDSGFNLPVPSVKQQYDVRYSTGPSGTLYAH